MIFKEKNYGIGLLKSSSGLLYSDMFGIVEDTGSTVPLKGISTNSSTSVLESTVSGSTPTKIYIT